MSSILQVSLNKTTLIFIFTFTLKYLTGRFCRIMTGITLFYLFWQDLSLVSVFLYVILKLWTIHFQFVFSYVYVSTGDTIHFLASWEENEASQKDKLWVKLSIKQQENSSSRNFQLSLTSECLSYRGKHKSHLNQGR